MVVTATPKCSCSRPEGLWHLGDGAAGLRPGRREPRLRVSTRWLCGECCEIRWLSRESGRGPVEGRAPPGRLGPFS